MHTSWLKRTLASAPANVAFLKTFLRFIEGCRYEKNIKTGVRHQFKTHSLVVCELIIKVELYFLFKPFSGERAVNE